jgi:hypothetical protein
MAHKSSKENFVRIFTHHDQYGSLVFRIQKIKSIKQIREACRHNRRQIAKEMQPGSHITSQNSHLNFSLTPEATTETVIGRVEQLSEEYQVNMGKKLQSNAVRMIEVVFSLPAEWFNKESKQYFVDCLNWSIKEFDLAEVLLADVHMDEACPHMHVLICCIRHDQLTASKMCGNRRSYQLRSERFFDVVAKHYGLELPPPKLRKIERLEISKRILDHIEKGKDPSTLSVLYPAIKTLIQHNPIPFALNLGLPLRTQRDEF